MKNSLTRSAMVLAVAVLACVPVGAQDLQQKLAAAKQSAAAANQASPRRYSWLEKTELSLEGDVNRTEVDMCRYGPDGKVQKSPDVVTLSIPDSKLEVRVTKANCQKIAQWRR